MTTVSLTITEYKHNYALFDDGARVSWDTHMVCTCVLAQRQDRAKNCCKHVVYLIREGRDRVLTDKYIYIPVVLPGRGATEFKDVCWASIRIDNGQLWVQLGNVEHTFVCHVSEDRCRLEVRSLVIPHLLGLVHQVKCKRCLTERQASGVTGTAEPLAVIRLLHDRQNQELQIEALREVCHWMENKSLNLCIKHDDTDLVPF